MNRKEESVFFILSINKIIVM